jgi:transposase
MTPNAEREELVVQLVQQGLSATEVAERLHHGLRTVYRILEERGVPYRSMAFKPLRAEVVREIVERYQSGQSLTEIAHAVHVDWKRVRGVLLDAGLYTPKHKQHAGADGDGDWTESCVCPLARTPVGNYRRGDHGSMFCASGQCPDERCDLPPSPQRLEAFERWRERLERWRERSRGWRA